LFEGAKIPKTNRVDGPTIELFFFLIFMVALGGTTTPILFQWLVSRDVLVCTPSFHDIIIPIFTSLLLVLVYIQFRGFICSMNKTERIILVRARPILLPNIIRKPPPKLELKTHLFYFLFPIL